MNVEMIKELRGLTAAAMSDCKGALIESNWDLNKAIDLIKVRGKVIAQQRDKRNTTEGRILVWRSCDGYNIAEITVETDYTAKSEAFNAFCEVVKVSYRDKETIDAARETFTAKTKENIELKRVASMMPNDNESISSYLHSNQQIGVICRFRKNKDLYIQPFMDSVMCQITAMNPLALTSDGISAEIIDHQMSILQRQVEELNKPVAAMPKILEGKKNKWFSEVCLMDQESIEFPKKSIRQLCKENEAEVLEFIRFQVGEGTEKKKSDFANEVANLSGMT